MSEPFSVKIPNDGIPIVTWHAGQAASTPDEWAKKIIGNPQLFGSGVSLAMTYAAIAAAIRVAVAEALAQHHCDSCDGSPPACWTTAAERQADADAIRAAVAAEREACARMVELAPTLPELCDLTDIAAAIRARGEPTA